MPEALVRPVLQSRQARPLNYAVSGGTSGMGSAGLPACPAPAGRRENIDRPYFRNALRPALQRAAPNFRHVFPEKGAAGQARARLRQDWRQRPCGTGPVRMVVGMARDMPGAEQRALRWGGPVVSSPGTGRGAVCSEIIRNSAAANAFYDSLHGKGPARIWMTARTF